MNNENKTIAVRVIKAILSVKVNGNPNDNQVVEKAYRIWPEFIKTIGLCRTEEFIEVVEEIKKQLKVIEMVNTMTKKDYILIADVIANLGNKKTYSIHSRFIFWYVTKR